MHHRLFELLHHAHARFRRGADSRAREATGLTLFELTALFGLGERDDLSVTDLARRLDVDHAAVSRLASQLVRKGVARREPDPTDGRRTVLVATPAGREAASRGRAVVHAANASIAAAFSPDELDVVARFLQHLIHTSEST